MQREELTNQLSLEPAPSGPRVAPASPLGRGKWEVAAAVIRVGGVVRGLMFLRVQLKHLLMGWLQGCRVKLVGSVHVSVWS